MLSQWNFDNSYLELPKIFFSKTKPNQFSNLELILKNHKLIDKLSLDKTEFDKFIVTSIADRKKDFYSQAYAGHQFGHFTILGDGRATLLGEHINRENKRFDIQLKGSGKTPYSRNGDGKGTLKSMLREYNSVNFHEPVTIITKPVKVQIIIVSIYGSNKATTPSLVE